jgi:hypothetical protein
MPAGTFRSDGRYEPSIAYGQSKTANVLFAVELNRRGVKSFAVMPGSKCCKNNRVCSERY